MDKPRSNKNDWLKAFLAVGIVLVLYRYIQNLGWIGNIGAGNANLTLGISFLTGVAASVSSCLAVVGAVVIAFAQKYEPASAKAPADAKALAGESSDKADENKKIFYRAIKPNLLFHAGRIATFFVLGGALGAIGGAINLSGNFVAVYTIIIALVMAWLGLNILGIVPPITALGIRLPKSFTKFWIRLEESEHQAAPALLGGLTFFLPCGFTQSMQILALASGNFWAGAFSLSVFALGTLPVLLALGISTSWGKMKKAGVFQKAVGMLILIFAIFTFNSGLALTGKQKTGANVGPQKNPSAEVAPAEQVVEMKITSRGFEPNILRVKNNVPVRFVVNGDEATGCTSKIVIPSLNVAKNITAGENIITFVPRGKGNVSFSCWMGMVRGKFIVQ